LPSVLHWKVQLKSWHSYWKRNFQKKTNSKVIPNPECTNPLNSCNNRTHKEKTRLFLCQILLQTIKPKARRKYFPIHKKIISVLTTAQLKSLTLTLFQSKKKFQAKSV
jgi:hypothetical protein